MLRRTVVESSMFPQSMANWTTSQQYEDIRDLQVNSIALQDSLEETETELGNVTLSLNCGESLVKGLTKQIRELQDTKCSTGRRGITRPGTCQQ